jgi:hypothetical protein
MLHIMQVGVAVMLYIIFRRCMVQISARYMLVLTEVFRGFTQSLPGNTRTVSHFGHSCYFPNLFQYIIPLWPHHLALYNVAAGSIINCSIMQVKLSGTGSRAEAVALWQQSVAVFTALSDFSVGSHGGNSHCVTQTVNTAELVGKIIQISKCLVLQPN